MAKKPEPKGQRVKTFKYYVPQPDLSKEEETIVVYLKAGEGRFYIYQGVHMFAALHSIRNDDRRSGRDGLRYHADHFSTPNLAEIEDTFKSICVQYEHLLRDQNKKRVIRFMFKRNLYGTPERLPSDDISFCGRPAIHFDYEILWQVGPNLFKGKDGPLHYAGQVEAKHARDRTDIVEWSPEREAFFENMRASLITLIHRVEDFQKDLVANIDLAIAGGGTLLLPGPEQK